MTRPVRSLRIIGKSTTNLDNMSGEPGEIFYDTTNDTLRVYTGAGRENFLLANRPWTTAEITSASSLLNSAIALKSPIVNPTFTGTVTGTFSGNITGNVTGNTAGTHTGAVIGNVTGNVTGKADTAGNADTVTGGVYTTSTYNNPSWLTITASKVGLGNVTNESKSTMFSSPTFTGTTSISALSISSSTGTNGQVLSSTGTGLQWLTLSASSISNGNSNVSISSYNGPITFTTNNTLAFTVNTNGSVEFEGSVTVNGGATTLSSTEIKIEDAMLQMADGNPADLLDIGLFGHYTSGTLKHTGFVRDATDSVWKLFSNISSNPSTTVDFAGAVYDALKIGALTATTGNFSDHLTVEGVTSTGATGTGNLVFSAGPTFSGTVVMGTPLGTSYGGTGANSASGGLTNLLPVGEVSGYVLTTSGRGGYYWAAAAGGGGTEGTAISTSRVTYTASASQTVFTEVGTYTPGAGQLRVYIDGVRQFPSEYTETSSTSFTLGTGVPVGTKVLAEVDVYTSTTITAASVTNSPAGSIESTTVQTAINELDTEKAPKADPTFTGTVTIPTGANITNPTISGYTEAAPASITVGTGTTAITDTIINSGTVLRYTLTASQTTTFTMPTATAGKAFVIFLKQPASGSTGSATFTNVKWGSTGAPTITIVVGKMDILTFVSDGTNWYGSIAQGYTY